MDNRSSISRQLKYSSIACTGSGSWSATLQYGSSPSGPWTSVPGTALVDNASAVPVAYGFLYTFPNYYRVLIGSGSPTCAFSGFQNLFVAAGTGNVFSVFGRVGNVVANTGDYTASQVTNAVDSTGSYANPSWITSIAAVKLTGVVASANGGAGTVNGILKSNGAGLTSQAIAGSDYVIPSGNVATATALAANPTDCSSGNLPRGVAANGNAEGCAAVSLTADVSGTLPGTNGGTGLTSFSRSGNTTEFASVSGSKTINKQLAFDASGNVVASSSDIGGGSSVTYVPTRTSGVVLTLPELTANVFAVGGSYLCGSVAAGATVTVSSGTGTIWLAVASDCSVVARHNIVASCSAG